jgi:hypothetical protein
MWHIEMSDPEATKRIVDSISDRNRSHDGSSLADTLDPERVRERREFDEVGLEGWEMSRPRKSVVQ